MSFLPVLLGAFLGTYMNNKKFRADTDKFINNLVGQGLEAINGKGGAPNADKQSEQT